jgi:hypothetical protein
MVRFSLLWLYDSAAIQQTCLFLRDFMKYMHWLVFLSCLSMGMAAQTADQPGQQRRVLPGDRVVGKVTAVSSDSVTVSPQGGSDATLDSKTPFTIKVSDTTRINKQREPIKLNEIKPGDTVFAVGHRDGNTIQAAMLGVVSPEMVARMSASPGARGGFGQGGQFTQEDLGKKFILGTVKAINETKLTIVRTDGQTQEIEVDENTSFRKSRESITLPDVKVGDFVMGRGELKNNVFVPRTLNVGPPQPQLPGGAGASTPAPTKTETTPVPTAKPAPTKSKDAPPQG